MSLWKAAYSEAAARGARTYRDPATGYSVMTEWAHRDRGSCCGSGCRHCPFDYAEVPPTRRASLAAPWVSEPDQR